MASVVGIIYTAHIYCPAIVHVACTLPHPMTSSMLPCDKCKICTACAALLAFHATVRIFRDRSSFDSFHAGLGGRYPSVGGRALLGACTYTHTLTARHKTVNRVTMGLPVPSAQRRSFCWPRSTPFPFSKAPVAFDATWRWLGCTVESFLLFCCPDL